MKARWSKITMVSVCVLALLCVNRARAEAKVEFSAPPQSVACYDFLEITARVSGLDAKNPFTDASLKGEFKADADKAVTVEGFCDSQDGTLFRIRFMPSKPGPHSFKIELRNNGTSRTHEGSFRATDERRKGIVRIDPQFPGHFQFEGSKERFFYNGTTAYFLAGWSNQKIPGIIGRLDHHKVTRIRAALSGRVENGKAWFENVYPTKDFTFLLNPWVAERPASVDSPGFDVRRFNVAFWRNFEVILREARTRDMAVSVIFYVDGSRPGVDPFGKSRAGGPEEQLYYRYAIARFGSFCNVMWDLANEYRLFRDDAWAQAMGKFVKETDPYQHLTSVHGHGDFRFGGSTWADFAMYQSWDEHGGWDFMLKNREVQARTGRIIPQVNEEYGYEDHYPQGWGENRKAPARSAQNRARLAWEIYLAGGYQTTGERADRGTGWGPDSGGGWLNGRGDDSMHMLELYGHIYDFFTSMTWWELRPDTNLVISAQPFGNAKREPQKPVKTFAARNAEGNLAAIYVRDGGIVTLREDLLKDQLKPLWYSPRDGGMRNARALRSRVYKSPTADDWVLLFRAPCNCSFRDFDNEFEK